VPLNQSMVLVVPAVLANSNTMGTACADADAMLRAAVFVPYFLATHVSNDVRRAKRVYKTF